MITVFQQTPCLGNISTTLKICLQIHYYENLGTLITIHLGIDEYVQMGSTQHLVSQNIIPRFNVVSYS